MRDAFPKPTLNGINLYDVKDHMWFGTALASFGICYNKDVCRLLETPEPKTWTDLTDCAVAELAVAGRPQPSALAATAFMIVVEKAMIDATNQGRSEDRGWAEGMGTIRLIASNARNFPESGSEVPGIVSAGDAGAGMVIDFYGRSQVEAVGASRMGYIEPAVRDRDQPRSNRTGGAVQNIGTWRSSSSNSS